MDVDAARAWAQPPIKVSYPDAFNFATYHHHLPSNSAPNIYSTQDSPSMNPRSSADYGQSRNQQQQAHPGNNSTQQQQQPLPPGSAPPPAAVAHLSQGQQIHYYNPHAQQPQPQPQQQQSQQQPLQPYSVPAPVNATHAYSRAGAAMPLSAARNETGGRASPSDVAPNASANAANNGQNAGPSPPFASAAMLYSQAQALSHASADQRALAGGQYIPMPRLPPILQVEKQQVTTSATQAASASRRRNEAHFVCPVPGCGSTFTRRFNLRGHLRSHTEERPYVCEWPGCGKGFARQHDCKRHQALHTQRSQSNVCQGCGKTFSRLDALNRHLRSEGAAICRASMELAQLSGGAQGGLSSNRQSPNSADDENEENQSASSAGRRTPARTPQRANSVPPTVCAAAPAPAPASAPAPAPAPAPGPPIMLPPTTNANAPTAQ